MNERVDFSDNANVYDRRHGSVLTEDVVQRLAAAASIRAGTTVLEIGAGTGRVAIALAALGCHLVALEPARGMADALRAKAGDLPVRVIAGEGGHLPFSAGQFDVVVIARVLYLAADWRDVLREAHRVLAAGGRLLHEWGNGQADEEWVQIREKARTLFEDAGVSSPFHPGVRSESEVDEALEVLEFVRSADISMGPGPTLTLAEFLRRLADGEFSYIWNVPQAVQEHCLPRLKSWSERTFDLERSIAMPRELRWAVYRKEPACYASTEARGGMHVKVLEYIEYPEGRPWQSTKVSDPSWADIEAAVRRLDRHRFPFLFLWPSTDERTHEVSGDYDAFEVMGGDGAYWLAGTFDGYFQRRLDYPERGELEVAVWTTDQGFADAERHICGDVEAVVRAARYYAEHGGFDPSLQWEQASPT